MRILPVALTLLLAASPSIASADSVFPLGAIAQVQTQLNLNNDQRNAYANGNTPILTNGVSTSRSAAYAGGTGSTSINLSTGVLRAAVQGSNGLVASSEGTEFLQFNTGGRQSANVSYAFGIDGSMFNTDPRGFSSGSGSVFLFDVTGLNSYFVNEDLALSGQPPVNYQVVADGVPLVYGLTTVFTAYGSQINPAEYFPGDQYIQQFLYGSDNGIPIQVGYTQTGTFQISQGHTYLIDLELYADASSGVIGYNQFNHLSQGADFSNTAVFQFTNLDGTSVSSSSGQFLTVAPTPEPSSFVLLGTGALGSLAMIRRKYKRS